MITKGYGIIVAFAVKQLWKLLLLLKCVPNEEEVDELEGLSKGQSKGEYSKHSSDNKLQYSWQGKTP